MSFDLTQTVAGAAGSNSNLSKDEIAELKALEAQFGFSGGLSNNTSIKHFRLKHSNISFTPDLIHILNIYSQGKLLDSSKIYQLSVSDANMDYDKHNVVVPVSLYNSDDILAIDQESMIRENGIIVADNKSDKVFDITKVHPSVNFFVALSYSISDTTKAVTITSGQVFVRKNETDFLGITIPTKQGVFTFGDDRPVVGVEKIHCAPKTTYPSYMGGGNSYYGGGGNRAANPPAGNSMSTRRFDDDFNDDLDTFGSRHLSPNRPGLPLTKPPVTGNKPPKTVKVKKVNATHQLKKAKADPKAKAFNVNPFPSTAE